MKNKKKNRVMFLLILILGITIGFALLSTTLFINGTASIKSNTWNIHWDDESINVESGSVSAALPVVSTATTAKDTVSFDVELEMPGDYYEFEIDAVNEGTVDGALDLAQQWITYTIDDVEASLPSYLEFNVTYDDGSIPQSGDVLEKRVDQNTPGRQTYKVRVEFKSGVEELPSNPKPVNIVVELPYVQYKEEPTPQPVDEFACNINTSDDALYYAPGIDTTTTFDPTWTVFGVDNRTTGEKKVCFVYDNQVVGLTAHPWDCEFNSTYTGCTNDDSYVSKGVRKGAELYGDDLETYLFAGGYNMQIYKEGTYDGFYINDNLVGASTNDGRCEHDGRNNTLRCEVH